MYVYIHIFIMHNLTTLIQNIIYIIYIYIYIIFRINVVKLCIINYSYLLPLRSVGRSNFDKGLHNLTTSIKKRHKLMIKLIYDIMESTEDSYEKRNTINNMSIKSPNEKRDGSGMNLGYESL